MYVYCGKRMSAWSRDTGLRRVAHLVCTGHVRHGVIVARQLVLHAVDLVVLRVHRANELRAETTTSQAWPKLVRRFA